VTEEGCTVRLVFLLALLAIGVVAVRARRRVEVWHVAADQPA
jgi:hypothetical protein